MSSDKLDVGDRMKRYERVTEYMLSKRIPVIVRVDGRAFHTITRKRFKRSWSLEFANQMISVAKVIMADIQGCSICYS